MDLVLLITGIVQIALSMVIGIFFIFFASKVFHKLTSGINENEAFKENNIAVAVLNGSIILSLILVVKNSVDSAITIFSNTLRTHGTDLSVYFETGLIMLGHIVLAGIIAFSAIYIAMQIFLWLTKDLDEMKEIKNNNIAVSIVLGIIIISIALILQPGIKTVLDALIPFPPVSLIDIG